MNRMEDYNKNEWFPFNADHVPEHQEIVEVMVGKRVTLALYMDGLLEEQESGHVTVLEHPRMVAIDPDDMEIYFSVTHWRYIL